MVEDSSYLFVATFAVKISLLPSPFSQIAWFYKFMCKDEKEFQKGIGRWQTIVKLQKD